MVLTIVIRRQRLKALNPTKAKNLSMDIKVKTGVTCWTVILLFIPLQKNITSTLFGNCANVQWMLPWYLLLPAPYDVHPLRIITDTYQSWKRTVRRLSFSLNFLTNKQRIWLNYVSSYYRLTSFCGLSSETVGTITTLNGHIWETKNIHEEIFRKLSFRVLDLS